MAKAERRPSDTMRTLYDDAKASGNSNLALMYGLAYASIALNEVVEDLDRALALIDAPVGVRRVSADEA